MQHSVIFDRDTTGLKRISWCKYDVKIILDDKTKCFERVNYLAFGNSAVWIMHLERHTYTYLRAAKLQSELMILFHCSGIVFTPSVNWDDKMLRYEAVLKRLYGYFKLTYYYVLNLLLHNGRPQYDKPPDKSFGSSANICWWLFLGIIDALQQLLAY